VGLLASFCTSQTTVQTPGGKSADNDLGQVRLSEILIATPRPYDPQQMAEAQIKAEEVRNYLRQGDSFARLAEKYSQGPSAARGGDLGFFCSGHLAQSLDDLVFRMKVGDISHVVRTKQGFLILTVTDRWPTCGPIYSDLEAPNVQTNPDLARYVDTMKGKIYLRWYKMIPRSARLRQGSLTVEFSVQRYGRITQRKVSSSSGDADLEKAALKAIAKAVPFPSLPESLKSDHINMRLSFQYNPAAAPQN